jgi:cold shock CspA family protein
MPRRQASKLVPPKAPSGRPATGRITRLLVGQSHGFIRLRNGREAFFHRSDLQDVATFNALQVGDVVAFELIDDAVSGARGVRVTRLRAARR